MDQFRWSKRSRLLIKAAYSICGLHSSPCICYRLRGRERPLMFYGKTWKSIGLQRDQRFNNVFVYIRAYRSIEMHIRRPFSLRWKSFYTAYTSVHTKKRLNLFYKCKYNWAIWWIHCLPYDREACAWPADHLRSLSKKKKNKPRKERNFPTKTKRKRNSRADLFLFKK